MDIEANLREQLELAEEITALWDVCPESGEPTAAQVDKVYQAGIRLAELVIAADLFNNTIKI